MKTLPVAALSEACEECIEAFKGFTGSVKLIQFDPIQKFYIESATLKGDTSEIYTPDREYGWYRKFEKAGKNTNKRGK